MAKVLRIHGISMLQRNNSGIADEFKGARHRLNTSESEYLSWYPSRFTKGPRRWTEYGSDVSLDLARTESKQSLFPTCRTNERKSSSIDGVSTSAVGPSPGIVESIWQQSWFKLSSEKHSGASESLLRSVLYWISLFGVVKKKKKE